MIRLPKTIRDPREAEKVCNPNSPVICLDAARSARVGVANGKARYKTHLQSSSSRENHFRNALGDVLHTTGTYHDDVGTSKNVIVKVKANAPCPLFGRTRRVTIKERNAFATPNVVRICQAPVDDQVQTPYLQYAEMAKKLGAWDAVRTRCAFCACGCCPCAATGYRVLDAEGTRWRRRDMRDFDARVAHAQPMKIMYDKI